MVLLLVALLAFSQDVFVPPVPRGVGRDVKVRRVKQPIPFPREGQPWIRVRTTRFDVISSAGEPRTRAIARDLESLAAALTEASPRFEKARVPTVVFVFKDRRESQPYFDLIFEGAGVAGMYVRHGGGAAMFIDASRRGFERTAMHELVHDLLRQREALPPLWLEEGLAEYVANSQITNRGVIAGLSIKQHVNLLAGTPARTVADMTTVKNETAESASPYFYAQSWAAVHWLMQTDAVAFWPFLRDLETGTPLAGALRTHYGKTPDDLHRGIHNARDNTQVRLAATAPAVTTEARVMERPTLLYELGWFLYWIPGAGPESERLFREALRLDPKHARTLAAQGKYEAAIAADPNDPDIHLRYAESQLELAIGPFAGTFQPTHPERFRKARELAVRALNLGGDEARARGALGVSYLVEDDLAPGITALEQARALAPRRMDYAIQLYSMYLRTGARAKADALFAEAFENTSDQQVAFAARKVLLDLETERANTLALEGKLAEAAAVVRSLAATIQEPLTREDMERQADQMDALALVNSHIRMYNEAVRHSNEGMNKDALKILDELLAVANDPQVVRDATKLRTELQGRK